MIIDSDKDQVDLRERMGIMRKRFSGIEKGNGGKLPPM